MILGKGVQNAIKNIEIKIALALKGERVTNQKKIDQIMIDLDVRKLGLRDLLDSEFAGRGLE